MVDVLHVARVVHVLLYRFLHFGFVDEPLEYRQEAEAVHHGRQVELVVEVAADWDGPRVFDRVEELEVVHALEGLVVSGQEDGALEDLVDVFVGRCADADEDWHVGDV